MSRAESSMPEPWIDYRARGLGDCSNVGPVTADSRERHIVIVTPSGDVRDPAADVADALADRGERTARARGLARCVMRRPDRSPWAWAPCPTWAAGGWLCCLRGATRRRQARRRLADLCPDEV